jgi:tetratricopeptide (TPR) repeat protein
MYYFREQLARAREAPRTAIDFNQNVADGYGFLAQVLSLDGDNDAAIALLDAAFRLNPLRGEWLRSIYVMVHFNARRDVEAIAVFERLEAPWAGHLRSARPRMPVSTAWRMPRVSPRVTCLPTRPSIWRSIPRGSRSRSAKTSTPRGRPCAGRDPSPVRR